MIVAGSMIGSGIFIVSADIARQVGAPGWLLIVWILTGVFVASAAAIIPLRILAELINIGTLLAFVIVCAAVLIMRKTNPEAERPFRVPFSPLMPILGIGLCLLLMFSLPAENWWRLFGWLALGFLIYFGYGRKHSVMSKQRSK